MSLLFIALMLAGAGSAVAPAPGQTQAQAQNIVYLPWVANNETIGGTGPWYSDLAFQNLAEYSCALSVYVGRSGEWSKSAQLSLTPGSSRSVSSRSLAVPSPGAPMRFEASCPIAATVKLYSPEIDQSPWSDGARIISGYTGLGWSDVAAARATSTSSWVLPIVQTNSGWNTYMTVANLASAGAADVTVELYRSGNTAGGAGATATIQRSIGTGETWNIDALSIIGEEGWVGFARISSSKATGVIARRLKPSAGMGLTNVAVAVDEAAGAVGHRSLAPLLFNAYNGWNTGINIANPSDSPANVTLQYHVAGGGMLREDSLTIAPRAMEYVYTPGNVQEEGFVGSATILSDVAIVAAIDEVKYETTEGLSYMASSLPQKDAAIPVVFREDPGNGLNDNSGINIANLDPDADITVAVELVTTTGQPVLPEPISVTVPKGGNTFVYVPFVEGVEPGTVAAVRLWTDSDAGFVAISNDINYTVAGDGSVVFSATGLRGYYLVQSSTP